MVNIYKSEMCKYNLYFDSLGSNLTIISGKIYFTRKKDAQTREVPMSFCKLLKAFDTLDNNCWIKTWQNIYILLKAIAGIGQTAKGIN